MYLLTSQMCVCLCPLLCQVGELWRTLVCCKYINKIKSSQVILKGTLWCQVFQGIVCSVTVFPISEGQGAKNSGKDAVYRLPIVLVRTTGRMINHWWIVDRYIHRMQNSFVHVWQRKKRESGHILIYKQFLFCVNFPWKSVIVVTQTCSHLSLKKQSMLLLVSFDIPLQGNGPYEYA